MKTLGIIGGIGPESTIDYYRSIIAQYKQRVHTEHQPHILIQSIDLKRMQNWLAENNLAAITDYLVENLWHVSAGGADFAVLAANTAHIVFDEVSKQSPLPLISVVEVACQKACELKLRKLGLFGTKYTMTAPFYPQACQRYGLQLVIPHADEIADIHHIYFQQLLLNQFKDESRQTMVQIIERMHQEEQIEGLILGGTELPLLLRDTVVPGVVFLDTTLIHVERIVDGILSSTSA
ncbi:MAG: amino acid racemase [Planctomycetia bacterium]|nr:amino acid racemase [Planctomycetia bacterium]